jgi:hypothetical protein
MVILQEKVPETITANTFVSNRGQYNNSNFFIFINLRKVAASVIICALSNGTGKTNLIVEFADTRAGLFFSGWQKAGPGLIQRQPDDSYRTLHKSCGQGPVLDKSGSQHCGCAVCLISQPKAP